MNKKHLQPVCSVKYRNNYWKVDLDVDNVNSEVREAKQDVSVDDDFNLDCLFRLEEELNSRLMMEIEDSPQLRRKGYHPTWLYKSAN